MEKITLEKFNDLTYHLRIMMAFLHNGKVQDSDYLNGIISDLNSKGITRFLSEEDFNQSDIKDNYISYDDYRDTLLELYEDMYIQYQNELLSYDLSNISYKYWSGVTLIFEGKLDLSETKGNFDFSIILTFKIVLFVILGSFTFNSFSSNFCLFLCLFSIK